MDYSNFKLILIYKLLVILIILISETKGAEQITSNSPTVVLHARNNGGRSFKSVAKNYPDLSSVNFNNTAKSGCVLGTWIFYASKNYANFSNGVTVKFSKSISSCFNFDKLSERVTSMRFVGSGRDYRLDFIDLFSGIFFTAAHLRSGASVADLHALKFNDTNSIIVSGMKPWTLFSNASYTGSSKCVYPKTGGLPRFYRNSLDIGDITPKSFRKGCNQTH